MLEAPITPCMNHRRGFTLIELSIVLVIIGLVVSGILVGRDLIGASQVRRQVSQIEQFKTATTTFRNKYGGLPGDLMADDAIGFGMTTRSGAVGHGDANGIIESCNYSSPPAALPSEARFGCESALFWSDLSFAKLIPGSFTAATDTLLDTAPVTSNQLKDYLPTASLGSGFAGPNYIAVFTGINGSWSGDPVFPQCNPRMCFALVPLAAIDNTGFLGYLLAYPGEDSSGLTPAEAFALDSKMDDGGPFTGTVLGGGANSTEDLNIINATDSGWARGWGSFGDYPCLVMAGTGSAISDYSYAVQATNPGCSMNFVGQ